MILTPWVVEHPAVQALTTGTRWAYASLAAHADAHGAPDRTLADDLVARVARKQYRDNLTAAELLRQLPNGRWQVLAPAAEPGAQAV